MIFATAFVLAAVYLMMSTAAGHAAPAPVHVRAQTAASRNGG